MVTSRLDATTYRVRSRSNPDRHYRVTLGPDGWPAHCTCEGNFWRGDCAHREEIAHQVAREEASFLAGLLRCAKT